MLVIGAKGMAKELLEVLSVDMCLKDNEIVFYDDISPKQKLLYNRFKIMESSKQFFCHTCKRNFTIIVFDDEDVKCSSCKEVFVELIED